MRRDLEKRRMCGNCEHFRPSGDLVQRGMRHYSAGLCMCLAACTRLVHAKQLCPYGVHDGPRQADTTKGRFNELSRMRVPRNPTLGD